MKLKIALFLASIILVSCKQNQNANKDNVASKITSKRFQDILDSAEVNGAILIFDSHNNKYYSNDFEKAKEQCIPASTYKIPHTIIGLETGVIKDKKTIFTWDGNKRAFSIWEKDLILKDAFQKSCVPCYQDLASSIGSLKMKENLQLLKYGNMDVQDDNINNFWLIGNSKISPFQQIDFLYRFYNNQLLISNETTKIVKEVLRIRRTDNYTLSGKTGFALGEDKNTGWFVGYIEKREKTFYFATRITPVDMTMKTSILVELRKNTTYLALKELGII